MSNVLLWRLYMWSAIRFTITHWRTDAEHRGIGNHICVYTINIHIFVDTEIMQSEHVDKKAKSSDAFPAVAEVTVWITLGSMPCLRSISIPRMVLSKAPRPALDTRNKSWLFLLPSRLTPILNECSSKKEPHFRLPTLLSSELDCAQLDWVQYAFSASVWFL